MANRTIPVDIPEDLYLDCLVAIQMEPSEEHPVIAVIRRALRKGGMLGQGDGALASAVQQIIGWQEIADADARREEQFEARARERAIERKAEILAHDQNFGPHNGGLSWGPLLLPNSTRVRMQYKGEFYEALIAHSMLRWRDKPLSPSEFAAAVAGGTVRNPWRDLEIWCHPENAWVRAGELRKDPNGRTRLMHPLVWNAEQERVRALAKAKALLGKDRTQSLRSDEEIQSDG